MKTKLRPVQKSNLADDLTERIAQMIRSDGYQPGDRLPSIRDMARSFGVGHPTVREALKKLETIGIVDIRHGSGVYVRRGQDMLLISNPVYGEAVSKKLMVDLVEARISIETKATTLAASRAEDTHLERMAQLLDEAGDNLDNDDVLSSTNMAFHREIATASGNAVLAQLLEVLTKLFQQEQRLILDIYGSREKDHQEHVDIYEALRSRDEDLARERMKAHLEGVRDVLLRWDPERNPIT